MKSLTHRRWLIPILALFLLATSGTLHAQDEDEDEESSEDAPLAAKPIVVFNIASTNRVLEDIDYLFGAVDRKDMIDVIDGLLGDVGNLAGLQRDRPLGVMLFLEPSLTPRPVPVAYVPVDDAAELMETLGTIGATAKKISDDRYEVTFRSDQKRFVRLVDGYAFSARDDLSLGRDFSEPAESLSGLSTRYDAAIDVRPENIPPGMRELFLSIVRSRTQGELQQRDDESDGAYALRKTQGMRNLRLVEHLLTDTQSLTLGLDVSKESRKAVFEIVIEAKEESEFLEALKGLAKDPSRFTPVEDEQAAAALAINSHLDEESIELQTELFNEGEASLARALTRMESGETAGEGERAADPVSAALAKRLFEPLHRLLKSENLDGFAQFRQSQGGEYLLIGAVEVPGANTLETPLREVVDRVLRARPEADAAVNVEYDAAEAAGVTLHRLAPDELDDGIERVYGDDFSAYVGFDSNAVWFGLGGRSAVDALDTAISQVAEAGLVERNRDEAPFSLIVRANRLLDLSENDDEETVPRDAFSEENDTLRMNFRPTETGGRLRIELEEGFVRLLGLGISRRYDESQL